MGTSRASIQLTENSEGDDHWFWLPMCLGALLTWRWMLPVESAVLGETLWIAQLSLLLPIICAVSFWKYRTKAIIWNRWDTCLWLVVIGHWCSLVWLFNSGGQLRSAFNLCWEWTAIGCTFFSLRQSLRSQESRSDLIRLLMIVGVCMAGLGLWQHFVSYRWVLADYQTLQQEYDGLMEKADSRGLSRFEQEQLRSLQADFQGMNIPLDGSSREVFERRLADNRQPVGKWALTNSLGGLLAVLVILLAVVVRNGDGRRSVMIACLLLGLVCLWATHSRTAQVATLIGFILLAIERWALESRIRYWRLGLLMSVAVVGAAAILWGINGIEEIDFDSNFALRSLQFRLQYWVASLQAMFDAPLFGTGPGNFRQVYLHYKLAASSEQIADPHNAFLDVWANGGLLALLSTVVACLLLLRKYFDSPRKLGETSVEMPFLGWLSSPWILGAEIGLVGLFLAELVMTGYVDRELIAFAIAVPILDVLLTTPSAKLSPAVLMICSIVLGVHLMGAGGMEMPGTVLFGLCLIATVSAGERSCCAVSISKQIMLFGAGIVITCCMWITTTGPVRNVQRLMKLAQRDMYAGKRVSFVRKTFLQATEADSYDPEPWRLLGEFEFTVWQADPDQRTALKRAEDAWTQASERDPQSYRDHFRQAEASWYAFQQSENIEDAIRAEQFYEQADQKMPFDGRILSGWALAADAAEMPKKSQSTAKKAIEIHELSLRNGHWEKMLSEEKFEEMRRIAAGPE